jgi:predicted alpha/beta-hydrolase family hydrolase
VAIRFTEEAFKIKQYDVDPTSPKKESAWVLRTVGAGGSTEGMPMGLLLALTYAITSAGGGATTYQFSYRTKQGTTQRSNLT